MEPVNGDRAYDQKLGRKQIALKILSINVASHLRWDLNSIERHWNLQKQIQLLEDLCTITSGKIVTIPMRTASPTLGPLGNKMAMDFALLVYHRWVLRVYKIFKDLIQKKKAMEQQNAAAAAAAAAPGQVAPTPVGGVVVGGVPGGPPELNFTLRDEMFMQVMDPEPQASVDYLIAVCAAYEQKRMPILTATSIVPLTTNSEPSGKAFRFEKTVSAVEVRAQVYFDLCQYFLYNNANELAKKYVILCRQNYQQLQVEYKQQQRPGDDNTYLICDIDEAELNGVLLACGASALPDSLMQRFNNFVMNRGDDLIEILKADNVCREIPFVQRKIIELDMEAAALIGPAGHTKEVLQSIVALNTIRTVVAPDTVMSGSDFLATYRSDEDWTYFALFIQQHLNSSALAVERLLLREYVLKAITSRAVITPVIMATVKKLNLIDEKTIAEIKNKKSPTAAIELPEIARQTEWVVPETNRESKLPHFIHNCITLLPSPPPRTTHRTPINHQHQHSLLQTTPGGARGRRHHAPPMARQSQLGHPGPTQEPPRLPKSRFYSGLFLFTTRQIPGMRFPPGLRHRRAHVDGVARGNATTRVLY